MSLPTSGFTTTAVVYNLAISGDPGVVGMTQVTITTGNVYEFTGESDVEAMEAAIEAGLQTMADQIDAISGVTSVQIYKKYEGNITSGIRD